MLSKKTLHEFDEVISRLIQKEKERKEFSLELIPSENCTSDAVREVTGSILTDKYCEGYPGKRYYGGCQFYDEIENIAIDRAKQLFGAEEANVQPHSGSNANLAVYYALLTPGDTVLGPRLDHGGHLTHGSKVNFSGKFFNVVAYGVDAETNLIDYKAMRELALEHRPKLILCGMTAYSRKIDFEYFRKVADEVGAILMADVAHYAGLIVAGCYSNPFPHADVVTTTTHKTLRGPRGGIIMMKNQYAKAINKSVFPGFQGGPLMHQIAGKAVAFKEAMSPEFKEYGHQIVKNAQALSAALIAEGLQILTGGTDSHVMLIDLKNSEVNGTQAEEALGKVGITVNKNTIPNDPRPPAVTSGIRLGTPAITSRGFTVESMTDVAKCIADAIRGAETNNEKLLHDVRGRVVELCRKFPLFV